MKKKILGLISGLISIFIVGLIYFALQTLGVDTEQLGTVFNVSMVILLVVITYFISKFLIRD